MRNQLCIGCVEHHGVEIQDAIIRKFELDGPDLGISIKANRRGILQRETFKNLRDNTQAVVKIERLEELLICHIRLLFFRQRGHGHCHQRTENREQLSHVHQVMPPAQAAA